jgi:glucose-6-phosphate 1-epimerase
MSTHVLPESLRKFEISERVTLARGTGGLAKINVQTGRTTAEIYLHGAHVTGFQKNGEPPLLFLSRASVFAAGRPIRGGVPICFPWFGPREGGPAHGFVRILPWDLAKTSAAPDGTVTIRLRLPKDSVTPEWSALRAELVVTIADQLTMELIATNESADKSLEVENCLHTYFQVGDIGAVSIIGLQNVPFDDFAAGAAGARKLETDSVLRITKETNRVYPNTTGAVEIRDENLKRAIRVEKSNSHSTVVWNPWTTQKLPDDFDPAEHKIMVCVESGNVKQNKLLLAPGATTSLKVILSSQPL